MKMGCEHPRLRSALRFFCLVAAGAGALRCLSHLTVYLDVEIFDLLLLIEDLVAFSGYVLMTVGAFRNSRKLFLLGLSVVALERIYEACSQLSSLVFEFTAGRLCSMLFVEVMETAGLVLTAFMIFVSSKKQISSEQLLNRVWFLPVIFLGISFVGFLFANIGSFTDTCVNKFFMLLASLCALMLYTDPKGVPRWVAQRIRNNEEKGIN